jgi:hypothetical protein
MAEKVDPGGELHAYMEFSREKYSSCTINESLKKDGF